jgi:hypothetical protein
LRTRDHTVLEVEDFENQNDEEIRIEDDEIRFEHEDKDEMLNYEKITIKNDSPFASFSEIVLETLAYEAHNDKINEFFCPEFVALLLECYMPYCFIWASFTLQEANLTRLTNGIVDKYNSFSKSDNKKNILPHVYANEGYKLEKGTFNFCYFIFV